MEDKEFEGNFGEVPQLSDEELDTALSRLSSRASRYEKQRNVVVATTVTVIVAVGILAAVAVSRGGSNSGDVANNSTTTVVSSDEALTFTGFQELQIGADLEALKAANQQWSWTADEGGCDGYLVAIGTKTFMVEPDRSGRIESVTPYGTWEVKTSAGVGAGDAFKKLQDAYGNSLKKGERMDIGDGTFLQYYSVTDSSGSTNTLIFTVTSDRVGNFGLVTNEVAERGYQECSETTSVTGVLEDQSVQLD